MNERIVTVAAAQYPVEFIGTWTRYAQKVSAMVEDAAGQGAALLVFPEYASLELASLFPAEVYGDIHKQLDALQELLPRFRRLFCELAVTHDCYIVAPSFPELLADGTFVNRAYVCRPDASFDFQDKLIMTRFETEQWHITPGREAKVFAARFGRFAVNICYDAEFPLLARRQVEAGADLIVVPTCTDTHAGYYRVQTGSRARALENQCYVVTAPVVGVAAWSEAIDINVGAAGVFAPIDYGFPSDGVLATGAMNAAMWLLADLDLAQIARVRAQGQVYNYRDWARQFDSDVIPVTVPEPGWLVPAMVTSVVRDGVMRET